MNGATLIVACPVTWLYRITPCEAWGAPGVHGCSKDPGHPGSHVCPCGSRHREATCHHW